MRKLILTGLLFLTGCQNLVGPLGYRKPQRVDDPSVTIGEQEQRARDRLALPDDIKDVAPPIDTMPRSAIPGAPIGGKGY
jgi:hypothetical protein